MLTKKKFVIKILQKNIMAKNTGKNALIERYIEAIRVFELLLVLRNGRKLRNEAEVW